MDSVSNQSEFEDASDLYTVQNTAYLKGLLFSVVNTIPVVEVECHHSKVNRTDVLHLKRAIDEAKERNKILNQRLFEYFLVNDQLTKAKQVPIDDEDSALDTARLPRYRQLLMKLKSIKDKLKNLEETVARQVDDIAVGIAKSREDLMSQHSELQKSIETVAAKLRADNSTNLTNQMISEIIARIQTEQNGLSAERTSFIKYKHLFRDLRLKAPSFDAYGSDVGINDLTKARIEAESLNEQVREKSSVVKELREKHSLANDGLNDRIKNNELRREQLSQTTKSLELLKRRLYEKRVRLSNLKHDHRKLLQSLKEVQSASPLTDNPSLYLDYERTMQTIKEHQMVINKYKVDLSD